VPASGRRRCAAAERDPGRLSEQGHHHRVTRMFDVAQAFRPAIAALKRCPRPAGVVVSCFRVFVAVLAGLGSGCASHHTTTGLVLNVDRPGSAVTISHEAFPGFMDAMAMPFELKGSARSVKVAAGDRVRLRLSVKSGRSWLHTLDRGWRP